MSKKLTPQDLGFKKKEEEEKKKQVSQTTAPTNRSAEVLTDTSGTLSGVGTPSGDLLMGMKPSEVRSYLGREEERTGKPQEMLKYGTQKVQENLEMLQQQQAEQPLPRTRELVPSKFNIESKDKLDQFVARTNLGEAMVAKAALKKRDMREIVELTDLMNELGLTPKQVSDDPVTQNLLKMQFNELDLQVLESGKAKVSLFSQAIEALPLGRYAHYALKKTPTGQIKTLMSEIDDIDSDSRRWLTSAGRSPHLREQFADLMEESEDRILELESTIKLLVMQSPFLQANPEEVELLISKIDGSKTTLRERKFAAQDPLLLAQFLEAESLLG